MTTVLDHFKTTLFPNVLDQSFDEQLRDEVLNRNGGAGDGCSMGDILNEMPLDSNCGDDCKNCIDHAALLLADIRMAYGSDKPHHTQRILDAVVDVCGCYIRG